MALLSKSKAKKEEVKEVKVVKSDATPLAPKVVQGGLDLSLILKNPRITEKATDTAEHGIYIFDVHPAANKAQIRSAIMRYYQVRPVKIATIRILGKEKRSPKSGRIMKSPGGKKAMVYLKKGDTIEFV